MLYIIETFDEAIVIYTEEKGTTQAVGKSAYTLQPTLRLLFFKHHLEIVRSTFCYQSLYIHCYDDCLSHSYSS